MLDLPLTREQTEFALRFLLYRMGPETRAQFMADLPVVYARLYPSVDTDIIIGKTRAACEVQAAGADVKPGHSRLP